jgi:putative toxin-antitoxin system antitoxin component (TIGR02293 family)
MPQTDPLELKALHRLVDQLGSPKRQAAEFRVFVGEPSEMIPWLRAGVNASLYQTLRELLAVSDRQLSRIVRITPRTLKRRLKHGRLEPDESERVARLGRLLLRALEVFEDLEKARRWLRKPQVALGNETPLDHADTEPGARQVEDLLGRIEHGIPL